MPSSKKNYINTLAIIASLGGFLFGYDTAVISGTINFVSTQFHLDAVSTGWYVSSALVGCISGVAMAGVLSDKYGRKKVLILSALFFGVSAVGCTFAIGFNDLVLYRFIGGLGIGAGMWAWRVCGGFGAYVSKPKFFRAGH